MDATPVSSHKEQETIILCYILLKDNTLEICERLLTFIACSLKKGGEQKLQTIQIQHLGVKATKRFKYGR